MTEFSEKQVIDTLSGCMDRIKAQMNKLSYASESQLMARTLVMWKKAIKPVKKAPAKKAGKRGSGEENLEYNVRRAASYIIVDQFLFYDLLQRHSKKYNLPELTPLLDEDNPEVFRQKYIQKALDETKDYAPILGIDVLSLLPKGKGVITALNAVITTIQGLKLSEGNPDFIGKIFHRMIPGEIRKGLGAYYTGSSSARLLASLVLTRADMTVCDLACGSGTLLVESYHVLQSLYQAETPATKAEEIHKQLLQKQIFGNDITLFASHLAAMNLATQNLGGEIAKINITSTDGLLLGPEEVSTVSMDTREEGRKIAYPLVDCVIMNPPFSFRRDMPGDLIQSLDTLVKEWMPEKDERDAYIHKKMGLHGYFLLHADAVVKPTGTIAMILSSSTFTNKYSEKLLAFFRAKKYRIKYALEILSDRSAFSEDVTFKEFMIILQKGDLKPTDQTMLVTIHDEFDNNQAEAMAKALRNNEDHPFYTRKFVPTADLYSSNNWGNFFVTGVNIIDRLANAPILKNSNAIEGIKVFRGYDATYSEFLMLPNDEWTTTRLNEQTFRFEHESDEQRSCQIPSSFLIPAIRKSEDANGFTTVANCWVLNLPPELRSELDKFRSTYLQWAETTLEQKWREDKKKGHPRKPIVKQAEKELIDGGNWKYTTVPWFSRPHQTGCSESKGRVFLLLKFQPSARKTISTYCKDEVTANAGFYILQSKDDKFYASWFSSACFYYWIFPQFQVIHKDYWQLLKSTIDSLRFPDPGAFDEATKRDLIAKWEALSAIKESKIPSLPQQFGADKVSKGKKGEPDTVEHFTPLPERIALDKVWLKALGTPDKDLQQATDELYNWLREFLTKR